VPNKNFKNFYRSQSLLELKIEFLKDIQLIDDIVVNTDSNMAIELANKMGVSHYRREDYYASSECSQSDFFKNLAETTDTDIIIHTPCTSPLINKKSIVDAINNFEVSGNDSCNSVGLVKEYLWNNGRPLNYIVEEGKVPNSQDLPDVLKLTFGFGIIHRNRMIERKNIVGKNPLFYIVDQIEETDIDTDLDFELAKYLFEKFRR
jgi:N-acylneuraminate cytidylyltransferase